MKNIIKTLIQELKEMMIKNRDELTIFENTYFKLSEEQLIEDELSHKEANAILKEYEDEYGKIKSREDITHIIPEIEPNRSSAIEYAFNDEVYQSVYSMLDRIDNRFYTLWGQVKKLNSLLDEKEQETEKELLEFEKKLKRESQSQITEFEKILKKEEITVKEFTIRYGYGKTAQQDLRNDKGLPYHQTVQGGKVKYNVSEVEKWKQNQWR